MNVAIVKLAKLAKSILKFFYYFTWSNITSSGFIYHHINPSPKKQLKT